MHDVKTRKSELNQQHGEMKSSIDVETQALLAASEPVFRIVYLLPHSSQDLAEASRLGWYTPGILDAARPVMQVCGLPADIRESHTSQQGILYQRLAGSIWPLISPLDIDSLEAAIPILGTPFVVCITTNPDVANRTDVILNELGHPVLHVSAHSAPGRISSHDFDEERIGQFVRQVVDALARQAGNEWIALGARRVLSGSPRRKIRKHPLPRGGHNVTSPNERALAAFGFKLTKTKYVVPPRGNATLLSPEMYVARICQSADAVAAARSRPAAGLHPQLIDHRAVVAIASSYSRFYRTWKELAQRAPEEQRADARRALKKVFRATTYFSTEVVESDEGPEMSRLERAFMQVQQKDAIAFTAALSMLSCATLCPVLRLEPKLNSVRADVAELGRCVRIRAKPHYSWKQARMMRLLGQKMRSLVHPEFLRRIDAKELGPIEGLKLVTDLPLELMPSNGIPLGLRFDVSRVAPVPGNLFWQVCNQPAIRIPQAQFHDVLIVRSFAATDPIRHVLETALTAFSAERQFIRVRYRFVDVKTPKEFVDAVNAFKGAVMIFDGHGRYDGSG